MPRKFFFVCLWYGIYRYFLRRMAIIAPNEFKRLFFENFNRCIPAPRFHFDPRWCFPRHAFLVGAVRKKVLRCEHKLEPEYPPRWQMLTRRRPSPVTYRVDGVDVAQETERNEAAARQSWARQHAWLLLSFSLVPLRHPLHPLYTLNEINLCAIGFETDRTVQPAYKAHGYMANSLVVPTAV